MATVKPQLRGLLGKSMKIHLPLAITVGLSAALTWKYAVAEPRKKKYAEFYKTYDADKAFRVMRNAGLLQSVGPE
ncbi:cytochrome c oxidase subunit 6C-1 [Athalia rosae]|uniref:cytochrome c oxidase subunit 6C-1 n=1 Tax=Athalia rosae TaxID=37344 RepID=UPI002034725F|nr:cytochrome c oxidase subunit 6C-1 [Athalia rosae]